MSHLRLREQQQKRTIWQENGTLRFFRHHPEIVHSPKTAQIARREIRKAFVWLQVTKREIQQTRDEMRSKKRTLFGVPSWFVSQALCVHSHESGDWGNQGYFRGGMQFLYSTWQSVGGRGDPALASPQEQIYRSYLVWKRDGGSWSEWPTTSRICGLR